MINYININLDSDLSKIKIEKDKPVVALISQNYLKTINYNDLFKLIKQYPLFWIVLIGENSDILEDEFDTLLELESIKNDEMLNVVTTNFQFRNLTVTDIEDISYEFLILPCPNGNCQYLSFLDLNHTSDRKIFDFIKTQLNNKVT
ncbi:hypothetical protein NEIMUCOT_06452 [Neisseria mucosa ATCC 25996]|jgi:hypothetical protein|uniref:Uncharacterized protein n=1 Tax=Neisseria mucosa (strain ATCC 25996 / DSM 4631 / NCTC 10774 / M26) TaxID=546266 RepID=D3A0L6_NEIM2|nr:hypothetical protein [Neisseria mucosa]OFM98894.1 hypothetical protein HMPREF2638_05870 [Neisseria sp. HMSC055F11]OFN39862.1 hypothetical protein HMPREF2568_10190 [Neisseria sp. HMSC059F02]OFV42663.1 hypothetical protein HMPREF3136_02275 [Neisseria sp. HMSC15C08]OHR46365.1 hypothetical protein HMPREF3025_10130 [Neisseria sp. HMSC070E12]EFC87109.1 hypothetical protein NEIMUCOT_06452 [Neisseria mucosa ATCC 25996]